MLEQLTTTPLLPIIAVGLALGLAGALLMAPSTGYRWAVLAAFVALCGVGVAWWFLAVEGGRDDLTPWFGAGAGILPLLTFFAIAPGRRVQAVGVPPQAVAVVGQPPASSQVVVTHATTGAHGEPAVAVMHTAAGPMVVTAELGGVAGQEIAPRPTYEPEAAERVMQLLERADQLEARGLVNAANIVRIEAEAEASGARTNQG